MFFFGCGREEKEGRDLHDVAGHWATQGNDAPTGHGAVQQAHDQASVL